jgi:hypothetical protein
LELVRSTLAAIPIFAMMFLDVPIETLLAIEKILRGFLWKGRKDAHGGHCLVAWDRVCMPKELGGLGIINLRRMNLALRTRWLSLSRVEASRPWKEFDIRVPAMVTEIFKAATSSVVGDGASTFFLIDRWLPDGRLKDLAPYLFALIPKRLSRSRFVKDCLDGGWLDDIPADLDALAIDELMAVADRVEGLTVTTGVPDIFKWNWGAKDVYSANSCYLGMFHGSIAMAGALQSGSPEPQPNVDSSFGWRCATDAGRQTGSRDAVSRAPRRALCVTKFRSPFLIFCLVVYWRGQCGPPASGGGIERIGCRRKESGSPIGFSPGGEDQGTFGTSGRVLPWCVGACGGIEMTSSSKAPPLRLSQCYA